MHLYMYMYIYIYTFAYYRHIYTYIHMYVYVYIIYAYIYIYTNIYTEQMHFFLQLLDAGKSMGNCNNQNMKLDPLRLSGAKPTSPTKMLGPGGHS